MADATVTPAATVIGTRPITLARCPGAPIQPCETTPVLPPPGAAWVQLTDSGAAASCAVPPIATACSTSVPAAVPMYVNVATPAAFVEAVPEVGFAPVTVTCTRKFPIGCACASGAPKLFLVPFSGNLDLVATASSLRQRHFVHQPAKVVLCGETRQRFGVRVLKLVPKRTRFSRFGACVKTHANLRAHAFHDAGSQWRTGCSAAESAAWIVTAE